MKKIIALFSTILTIFNLHNATAEEIDMSNKSILVVYFSKTGEQYSVGNITEGNTAIIAKMIAQETGADIFEVKLQNDTYPTTYKELTEVALAEKKAGARPEISGKIENFADYDVIFIGTPNWWADLPMPMYTFMESYNWNGKTIVPFVTHEGSGLSSIPNKIKSVTGAEVLDGLAIYGHIAQNEREEAQQSVKNWLKDLGL